MSSFNQDPYRPVGDPTVTSTGETGERARAAADSLVGPAGDVKDTAVAAGKDVLETAKHEAGQVVGEAKTQGRRLLDESVGELRGQAETIQARLADTVQVMYGGRIAERGPVDEVFASPRSAYTWGLLQSLPHSRQGEHARLFQIPGQPPDMLVPPKGDPFAPRNRFATPRCFEEMPPLRLVPGGDPAHLVAAWYDLPACLKEARS